MATERIFVESSFTARRWVLREGSDAYVRSFALSQTLARLLDARGIGEDQVQDTLEPTLRRLLPEPMMLAGMDRAVARVQAALEAGERIAVFGDYDVDGSCSAALLHDFLAAHGAEPLVYIPDRMAEGYGPNEAALLGLKAQGAGLIVTVDCGAGAPGPLAAATATGLDVVVLDHHATHTNPPCLAHVNPNGPDDASGQGHLCAAGVTFLFLVALNRALREAGRRDLDLREYLDLVALATVCDVVPLVGVNRAFVRTGLAYMSKLRRPGLSALAEVAGAAPPFSAYTLGFVLGPRINAGGRVGRSTLGFDLLTAGADAAADYAAALDAHNRERQAIEALILEQAQAMAGAQDGPFVLVAGDGWHPGVVGIVAGRLKERFNKPALVAGFEGGLGRGSARSVPGRDIGAMVREAAAAGLLEAGGGHAMAAGFSLVPDQVEPFRAFLAQCFAEAGVVEFSPLAIEATVAPSGATPSLIEEIARIGPFGAGNPEPLVLIPGVAVAFADVVKAQHIRVQLAGGDGTRLTAMAWRAADTPLGKALLSARGSRIHAVGRLKTNAWNGRTSAQLHIEDAAAAEA